MNLHMLKSRFHLLVGLFITLATISLAQISDIAAPNLPAANKATLFLTGNSYGVGATPSSVAAGDFNGDGKADLAVANLDSNNVSILVGQGSCGLFKSAVNYPAGARPTTVAVGDLNGDGKLDLAVANNGSTGNIGVTVLLGNGDATFGAPTSYRAGVRGFFVAIGDFNSDGKPDLAVANNYKPYQAGGVVSVLLGKGDGTFQAAVNYSPGPGSVPNFVAVGDLNADDRADLIVTNTGSNNVSVLLGKGDGTFRPALNYHAGEKPTSAGIGDFNGDSKLDLAVASLVDGSVSVLLGNGDGTFQAPVKSYAVGAHPYVAAVGDLNSDGKLDLAVASSGSGEVSVLLGKGDGSFKPVVNYATGPGDRSVAIADFNGDAKLDLAVANGGTNNVTVLLGSGGGGFQSSRDYGVAQAPISVATGDFNGDGKLDSVVANEIGNNVSVLLGKGPGTFQPAVNYKAGIRPIGVAVGDLNGDGKLDLAIANNDPSGNIGVSVLLGNGHGAFSAPTSYHTDVYGYSVAIGDFNRDGKPDLAVANNYRPGDIQGDVSVLLGKGDGTFREAVNYPTPGFVALYVAVGDFNGDAKPDLAVGGGTCGGCPPLSAVMVFLGNGDGTFRAAKGYAVGDNSESAVAVGDFNGDSKLDLATANLNTNNVSVLLGNGDGTFQAAVNYAAGLGPIYVTVGDFNNDAKQDLAVANLLANNLSVVLGNGDGTFQAAVNYDAGTKSRFIASGDFNADGATDLVKANSDGNTVTVLLNTRGTVSTLTSSSSTSSVGDPVTFTADVNVSVLGSQIRAGRMTGTVTFRDGATKLGTVSRSSRYTTLTISSLSKGKHTITATYSGDSHFNPVTSPPLTQSVQ